MIYTKPLFTLVTVLGIAHAQSIVATSPSGQVSLAMNPAMVTFVPSNAKTVEAAAKGAVLSTAEGQAVAMTAARMIPIPVVGPLAGPAIGAVMKKLHSSKPTIGFTIVFLKGVSAGAVLPRDQVSFAVPAESLHQGGSPALLRIKPSAKDSTRIIRSLHVSVKVTGGSVAPAAGDTKVLGIEQETIPCRQETRGGSIVLTPSATLESGEYAIVLLPAQGDAAPPVGLVWDFRVL